MKSSKAQSVVKGPKAGAQALVIDPNSCFFGQVVTVLSDPIVITPEMEGDFNPGDVVNDVIQDGERTWTSAYTRWLVPIPPPAKAARMFGEKGVAA